MRRKEKKDNEVCEQILLLRCLAHPHNGFCHISSDRLQCKNKEVEKFIKERLDVINTDRYGREVAIYYGGCKGFKEQRLSHNEEHNLFAKLNTIRQRTWDFSRIKLK